MLIDTLNKNKKYEDALNLAEELITWPGADNKALFLAIKLRAKVGAREVDTSSKDTLSLCMIVKNEEDNIGSCLKKIKPLVDEMIVVDTGSTDKTKDLAKAFGVKVFDFPWNNNFSDARNFSIEKASGKWILILDADEAIAPSDFDSVKKLVRKSGDRIVAYRITTRNYVTPINAVGWVGNEGQYLNEEAGTGWFPSMKVRLFRKDERIRFEKPIHEMVEYSLLRYGLPFEQCDIPIHHYGKLDTGKLLQKGKEYYELGKKKLAEDGENDVLAIRELAIQAMELGLHEEALEHWKKVARIEPKRTQAHYGIGHCCFCLGKYEDARISLKKAVELDPNYKDAVILYAHCEIYTGDAEITIPLLEKILMNDPSNPRILLRLAFAYFCSGEKEKGLKTVNTLRNINIRCTEYFSDCAKDLISIKRYEYAKSLLEAALETNNADNETKNLLEECRKLLKEHPTP
ncbi:MAG: glycosyltransferase [Nitrospira sp.]|nr:glycosyltransferase [Nitrospira sp.]